MSRHITRQIYKYRYILYTVAFILCILFFYSIPQKEGFDTSHLEKNIWLLWLQGWESPPWLIQQVKRSWERKNPGWTIHLLTEENLSSYVDIDYIYKDSITPQAKSDIIRLSVLQRYGGVWADATLLCMRPLDSWVYPTIKSSGFWMYHGNGGGMDRTQGPASWFIVSKANSYIITTWKQACDDYWKTRSSTDNYFWMDSLVKTLYETDARFKQEWDAVPYINCEDPGESHMFANGAWKETTDEIKQLLDKKPPHVIKLWKQRWEDAFPSQSDECKKSNGYYAIQKAIY